MAQRDLELGRDHGERSAQLVRSIRGESSERTESAVEAREQLVERDHDIFINTSSARRVLAVRCRP